ncbi:hypothetical protein EPD60_10845 [Flaviaesturariibacter flavus]|uniref:Outer membrane protein beta-barrel domain-containing protein n=1 Tax=Flaviaesturariibacter flavus TaxID=2502780 RepID=A0A4R1BBX4_9BACT|nr:hypothetical protein [Flaviaesturariibacter flavus]TCJ14477.1 hypothetical protein EPD60_10845 [Flaviaesturariibacter flavus]
MRFLLFSCLLLPAVALQAQKTELRLALNSGVFRYTGNGVENTSSINYGTQEGQGYTNDVYGSHGALGYGASLDLQRVTRYGLLLGLRAGPEVLRSRQQISEVSVWDGYNNKQVSANGSTHFSQSYIGISPFLGWRAPAGPVSLDATVGLEFGIPLSAWESGSALGADGQRYTVARYRRYHGLADGRYRFQLGANYRRYGAYLGYSAGQIDMRSVMIGGSSEAYSRYLRFGLSRRF